MISQVMRAKMFLLWSVLIASPFSLVQGQCPPPSYHQILGLSSEEIVVETTLQECGGRFVLYEGLVPLVLGPPIAEEEFFVGGVQQASFVELEPDTDYCVCIVNYCPYYSDCYNIQASPDLDYCFSFHTLTGECLPPTGFSVLNTSEDSFSVRVTMDQYGGIAELYQGATFIWQRYLEPGTQTVNASQLEGMTTYTICFANYCDDMGYDLSDPICESITTAEPCVAPTDFRMVELTPISFRAQITMGPYGGRVYMYYIGGNREEWTLGPGRITVENPFQLTPDTQYQLCFWNACNENHTFYNEEEWCTVFRTPEEDCNPPESLTFTNITSDSFVLQVGLGPFGGGMTVSSDAYQAQFSIAAYEEQKTVRNLPSNTRFDVAVVNYCYDGSATEPTTGVVTTKSVGQSEGYLTAPFFVDERNVWVNADQRIEILLPDPHSDGWGRLSPGSLMYQINLVQDCQSLYQADVNPRSYPFIYKIQMGIPTDPYQIQIRRKTVGAGKDGLVSSGTVIVGPARDSGEGEISTEFTEIERWVLHVPRKAGGFKGSLVFNNKFPELPARIWVAGFAADGSYVNGTKMELMVIGPRAELPIYPEEGSDSLFPAALTDQISHIGLLEENGREVLPVSITYQQVDDPDALTATVEESKFGEGQSVGSLFTMEARKSANFWDGVAVLNVAGLEAAEVTVVQRDLADDTELGRVSIGTVQPGEKILRVVSDLFDVCDNCYYTVETDRPQTIEVLGLRGSLSGETAVLVGSQVKKKK